MLIIGLTGGMGSGKSTVAAYFAELKVPVINADKVAREVVAPGMPALAKLSQHFGEQILQANGELNRRRLREIIFTDEKQRLWLENYLHPLIRQRIQEKIQQLKAPYCIVEIPLLFEKNTPLPIDRILVIDAPEELQIQRTQQRDQISETEVLAMLQTQVSRAERLSGADDVIVNQGDLVHLRQQVVAMHHKYSKLA